MKVRKFQIAAAILAVFVLTRVDGMAGQIYLGVGSGDVTNATPSGVQTRYKIDNTNWDAMLGTGANVANGYFVSRDAGNIGSLSGTTFHYTVTNTVGEGISFVLNNPLTSGNDFSLYFGTGTPAPGNSSVSATTLLGPGGTSVAAQTTPYNGLHLYSQATAGGSTVSFANISFAVSTPGISLTGAFPTAGQANNATPVVDSYLAYFNDNGTKGDLSTVGWTFSADVTITGTPGSNPKEGAKFEFTGKSLDYTPPGGGAAAVPETSTWLMGFFALGTVLLLMRWQRNSRRS